MRPFLVLAVIALATPALAASKTPPVGQVETSSVAQPIKVGAVLPAGAQVIIQADGAYGIVIDQSRVLVVEPKSRKVIEILDSGA